MRFQQLAALLLAFGISQVVTAAPGLPYSSIHAAECRIVNAAVNSLKLFPSATPFCSTYLQIRTSTSTATVTKVVATTSTTYVATRTVTTSKTATAVATSTLTSFTSTQVITSILTQTSKGDATVTVTTCSGTAVPSAIQTGAINRRKAPIPQPVKSFAAAQISTACLCLGIPTPVSTALVTRTATSASVVSLTSTVTRTATVTTYLTSILTTKAATTVTSTSTTIIKSTTTVKSCPTPPDACNNRGLEYAVNLDADSSVSTNNFNPQAYKTMTPNCTGTTDRLGPLYVFPGGFAIFNDYSGCDNILEGTAFYFSAHTINNRGYIYAEQTGVYSFSSTRVMHATQVWLGDLAYSGWTGSNANLTQGPNSDPSSFSALLTAGSYYPIRAIYTHLGGDAFFFIDIYDPAGTQIQPLFVSSSCDGTSAPRYRPFGQET